MSFLLGHCKNVLFYKIFNLFQNVRFWNLYKYCYNILNFYDKFFFGD